MLQCIHIKWLKEELYMKFVIVGTGGTGGVLGAYLAHSGQDVTFIARGEHLQAIREHGLKLHMEHRGDILIQPAKACTMDDYRDTPDIMLVCVKYYGIRAATDFARRVAGPDTLIIPILNVFGTGGVMQEQLPELTVLDGCIYVFAKKGGPGLILQPQSILKVYFGFRPGQEQRLADKARETEKIMQEAEIETHFTPAIQREALTKFSFVSYSILFRSTDSNMVFTNISSHSLNVITFSSSRPCLCDLIALSPISM